MLSHYLWAMMSKYLKMPQNAMVTRTVWLKQQKNSILSHVYSEYEIIAMLNVLEFSNFWKREMPLLLFPFSLPSKPLRKPPLLFSLIFHWLVPI